ncbi:MAG: hypothetical protein IKA85_06140 [Clostridia bacterium]|nr:hypothetical protein [Clostridia bacterium]
MKRKTIFTSILTIIMCLSLMVGGTFALSTSESKVNVAVTSAKVNVTATIDQSSLQTKKLYDTTYTSGKDNMFGGEAFFTNEGLTLSNVAEGDGVKFNIAIANESTIMVKYRTVISCINDDGLFAGLKVNIADKQSYNGKEYATDWETLEVGNTLEDVEVSIELPDGAGKQYEGKTCTITYYVQAIQGNAYTGPEAIITRYDEDKLPKNIPPLTTDMNGIPFPDNVPNPVDVEAAWTFTATDTEETVEESPYKNWVCDFVIECDQAVEYGELGLWGEYGGWEFAFGNPFALPEGQTLFMLTSVGMPQDYYNICTMVKEFDCGVFRGLEGEQMKGKTITVSLCLINLDYAGQLIYDVTGKTDIGQVTFDEMLQVMKKENWAGAIGTNVLIANQTSYTFN